MSGNRDFLCYTDGSCKAGDGAPGGWGFVVRPPKGEAIEGRGSATGTLAKVMELRAVAEAIAVLPREASATVFSDNQALVENLTKQLRTWQENGFAKVDPLLVDDLRRIATLVHENALTMRYQWIRSHNGNAGNERADELARQGAREAKSALNSKVPNRRR